MRQPAQRWLPLLLLPLMLAGCGQKQESTAMPRPADNAAKAPAGQAGTADPQQAAQRRYLAVRHELRIVTNADAVEAAWKTASDACAAAECDVLESGIERDREEQPARAVLDVRVPPAKLDAFLAKVSALGTVGRHGIAAEDKTDEVLDVEARQKNTAEFRDNLRKLMESPHAKLSELIEIERELTRVQSELDSLASRRKALNSQTDKVRVSLRFEARSAVLETGTWWPVKQALLHSAQVLSESIAMLIGFVVAVLPWLLAIAATVAVLRAAWRRRRTRKVS